MTWLGIFVGAACLSTVGVLILGYFRAEQREADLFSDQDSKDAIR